MKTDCLSSDMDQNFQTTSRTQNDSNRRRFSDKQIKYMELMFEAESKPESQMKEQLANELGLQPHQVSIWFQNRRARLKSKQIEEEYNELRATYNALASSFESLQKENHSLLTKVQKLKQKLQHKSEGSRETNLLECKEQNNDSLADYSNKEDMLSSNEDRKKNEEETEIFDLIQYKTASIIEFDWNSFEYNTFLNSSSCSSNKWWEL